MKYDKNVKYGIYLITDRDILKGRNLIQSLEEAISGGVSLVQLREKAATSLEFYKLALEVRKTTLKHNIPLIINDRLDIAIAVDADGVHLGQEDLPIAIARKILGQDKIIGASTANLEEAVRAQDEGADYIGVGALFPTDTKTNTRKVTLDEIKNIKQKIRIPVVGIGGINEGNIKSVADTRVDGVALVSAILGCDNIAERTRKLYKDFFNI